MKVPKLTAMPVKEENGEKFVEGVATAWVTSEGRQFILVAADEAELEEIISLMPGGETFEPMLCRKMKCVDQGRLYPPSPSPAASRARLED